MRVLHVSTRREWRGGEQQLLHLARATGPIACPDDAPLAARAPELVRPVRFRGAAWGGRALRRVVARERPELIAAHDANALVHALRAGVPVVAHRRVDFRPSVFAAVRLRRCAGVIAASAAIARVLRAAGVSRVIVVHDGVEAPPGVERRATLLGALGLPTDAPVVLAVGALVAHKDHATLVEALVDLPGVHAVIAGGGPLRDALAERSRRLGVAPRLHLLGHRTDIGDWLRSVDAVVHPSRLEGLGQAVVEAVRVGTPVVTSDAGGLPEIPGVFGRVPAGDARALAARIREVLADPGAARRWTARAPVGDFSVSDMVEGTRQAWAALCAASGAPASPVPHDGPTLPE